MAGRVRVGHECGKAPAQAPPPPRTSLVKRRCLWCYFHLRCTCFHLLFVIHWVSVLYLATFFVIYFIYLSCLRFVHFYLLFVVYLLFIIYHLYLFIYLVVLLILLLIDFRIYVFLFAFVINFLSFPYFIHLID